MAKKHNIALFVTCLVDSMRPSVGFATIKLLEEAGCKVSVPSQQTCCGQPAYNSGDPDSAKKILMPVIKAFEEYDYVIIPSGSCAGMLKKHLPSLFPDDEAAKKFSDKCYELIYFLTHIMKVKKVKAKLQGTIAYHSSCSSLREVGLQGEAEQLLTASGTKVAPITDATTCCGFGGLFCMKYAPISAAMVEKKCNNIKQTEAEILTSADLGCLLNIAGRLKHEGSDIKTYHIAEVLTGTTAKPMGDE